MNFDWKKPLLVLGLMLALVVAGCGGDDDDGDGDSTSSGEPSAEQATGDPLSADEYASELTGILAPLGTELQEIGTATSEGSSNQDAIDGVSNASERLQTSINDLLGLVPPEDAADAHADLVASLEGFKDAADEFASTDPDDEEAITGQVTDLQDAVLTFQTDFEAAITGLAEAGVSLGGAPIGG